MNVTVSVVIASYNAEVVITECLTCLLRQEGHSELEIIVVDSSTDATPQLIEVQFPMVKLLHFNSPRTLSVMRGRGIALATGQLIAILDPYSMVDPDWLNQLLKVHADHDHPAIAGAVDLYKANQQGMAIWAQYFSEYGMFMSPIEERKINILPGSNISYKREILFDGDKPRFIEFWKTFVNEDLKQSGLPLWQTPYIRVALWKPIGVGDFFLTRFAHGRCYAGMRCANSGLAKRFLRLLSTPLIPFVLQIRWAARIWPKNRHRGRFILTLPMQFILFVCWAAGEFTGYLSGPGNSCKKLYY